MRFAQARHKLCPVLRRARPDLRELRRQAKRMEDGQRIEQVVILEDESDTPPEPPLLYRRQPKELRSENRDAASCRVRRVPIR